MATMRRNPGVGSASQQVTVAIATYNGAAFVEEAIESALGTGFQVEGCATPSRSFSTRTTCCARTE
jgi:hypothetical protein